MLASSPGSCALCYAKVKRACARGPGNKATHMEHDMDEVYSSTVPLVWGLLRLTDLLFVITYCFVLQIPGGVKRLLPTSPGSSHAGAGPPPPKQHRGPLLPTPEPGSFRPQSKSVMLMYTLIF